MRLVVIIVAALMILGLAALGLVLARRGTTSTATAASTVRIASLTQEVSALPTRAPVGLAQATGSEAPPLILQANVGVQSGSPVATVTQAPSAAAAAPNVKDQNPSTIAKALVHEATRLKDDATGWAHKLQELELDLNLQLDLKMNQDGEAAGKDINECLVVLRAAAGRLVPDAETRVTLREQEVAVRDLAIRAEAFSSLLVFEAVLQLTNASFDLLPWRLCHPRQLRYKPAWRTCLTWLHPFAPCKCRCSFRFGKKRRYDGNDYCCIREQPARRERFRSVSTPSSQRGEPSR